MYKTDANQSEMFKAGRKMGWSIVNCAMVGNGMTDSVWGKYGLNFLCEIKDPKHPPSARKLTFLEHKFHDEWKGMKPRILMTIEDIIELDKYALELSKKLGVDA